MVSTRPHISKSFFFSWLSLRLVVWPRLGDLKIPEQFVCIILFDRFWIVDISFVRRVIIIFIIIIIYSLEFFTVLAEFFHWSLSDSQSPQVSWTLLSILNNVVVWVLSTRLSTSKSSSPFSNPLHTVSNAPITIGIIVIFKFHSLFNSLARSRYLSFFSQSFSFILWSAGTAKSTILQVLFFLLLIIIRSDLLAEIRWSLRMSKEFVCVIF